ncbi:fumarylacetoacetate hydrolase family protein [Streptomyces sp. NPDC005483]|uniref:fumarylacetoacetate hydrolase family protein n=1 Tax=Streptomyces sp. NPDC005483 TaxID=3154882 RepID=UPI0033BC09B6
MKLATVQIGGRELVVFEGPDGRLIDLAQSWTAAGVEGEAPATLLELVERGPGGLAGARTAALASGPGVSSWTPEEVRWLPPIRRPSKIVGVAINNSLMAAAAYRYFDEPAFFLKAPSSMIGHGEAVEVEVDYGLTHPEPDLACVIATRSKGLSEDEALDAVFGYSIINDITSPGLKDRDSLHLKIPAGIPGAESVSEWRELRDEEDRDIFLTYHARSKGADTFGPMGPWVTTSDEVDDPNNLDVRAWFGNDLATVDSTGALSFTVQRVLSHLTRTMTLEPGDIVHFGTAARPAKYSLREMDITRLDGDLTVEIEGLGTLRNPVIRTESPTDG